MTDVFSVADVLAKIGDRTVVDDSRKAEPGSVFVWDSKLEASAGARMNGATARVIDDARGKGAEMIVTDADVAGVIRCAEPGKVLAAWAAKKWSGQPEVLLGVTGTSGKTSVAWFGRQLASACGYKAASIGTLGVMRTNEDMDQEYTGYTSPTALKLHPILQQLDNEEVSHCLMEIGSHALDMHRLDGARFAAGALTNISQDHLDYHKTMEAYTAAKMRLFTEVLPVQGTAVVNVNRPEGGVAASLAKQRGLRVLTVGTANAELTVEVLNADARGLQVKVKYEASPIELHVPLVGAFQAENMAVALGLLLAGGIGWDELSAVLDKLTTVPGRMEIVKVSGREKSLPAVVVDYAHKPDALDRALQALRPLVKNGGKLKVVFGCGGNRDALKRPLMGEIASRLADVTFVTDDNPRFEDPAAVRKEILAGVKPGADVREVGDREKAIEAAIEGSSSDDVVLVAGKGHEHGQIIAGETHPFDDRAVCREILSAMKS